MDPRKNTKRISKNRSNSLSQYESLNEQHFDLNHKKVFNILQVILEIRTFFSLYLGILLNNLH